MNYMHKFCIGIQKYERERERVSTKQVLKTHGSVMQREETNRDRKAYKVIIVN